MRDVTRVLAAILTVSAIVSCGGGSSSPGAASTPVPTPTPTPEPAGVVRFLSASVPVGSTVGVSPMFAAGQQAPQLWFQGAITLKRDLPGALVRAWVRTDALRCMGGGQARVDFQAGVERGVEPLGMSHPGYGAPMCTLPYTTTHVEFEVVDVTTQQQVLEQRFPAVYNFVAAP
jgi:hypothetical protein